MTNAGKNEREFCAACGWPRRGMRCEACGEERLDLHLADATSAEVARGLELNDAVGDKIAEAYRGKEWTRMVGLVVGVEGGASARTAAADDGPGWLAIVRGAVVLVTIRQVEQEIAIEAPLVRVPREQRVAALRAGLELSAMPGLAPYICLRDDLMILRERIRLGCVTPTLLRRAIGEAGQAARRIVEMLSTAHGARPAAPVLDYAQVGVDVLGTRRKLAKAIADVAPLAVFDLRANQPPPAPTPALPSLAPSRDIAPASEDDGEDLPPILAPMLVQRPSQPPPPPSNQAPKVAARAPAQPPPPPQRSAAPPLPPRQPPAAARDVASAFIEDRKRTIREGAVPAAQPPSRANSSPNTRLATLQLEAVGPDLEPSGRRAPPSGEIAIMPTDRLCALLKRAELLAGPELASSSPTLPWLVRAAVFRAVYEFRDALPDAVALLYRSSAVGSRNGVVSDPEAALSSFEDILALQGLVPKEKALTLDPLTTAQQAKDHVAQYISIIEQGAARSVDGDAGGRSTSVDVGLKHYLALGALCELLSRAKLPAQTSQRLRDIIGHASREGAKPAAVDLLMTALKRISA